MLRPSVHQPPATRADVRYIGNKTRLLPFIRRGVARLGLAPGVAHDAFAGTAAVGRALKSDGWRVVSSDLMTYSYVFQQAYVVASRTPTFAKLVARDRGLRVALQKHGASPKSRPDVRLQAMGRVLAGLDGEHGFISEKFSPRGDRMYFTERNAGTIDAARRLLHEWQDAGLIDETAYHVLLAALIEGADRVANTAGVYAAYIKSWQPNALRPLTIEPLTPIPGAGSSAHRDDAVSVARRQRSVDLLYLDPPYNSRQYAGYYHVPEIIARGWFDGEPALRGKTGLLNDAETRSVWCSRSRVSGALRALLAESSASRVLVSYNSEGLLPQSELERALKDASADGKAASYVKRYKRYRADRDRPGRKYARDWVEERLFYAKLPGREGETL
jgi:adenine-specific DNA-methyltransferase